MVESNQAFKFDNPAADEADEAEPSKCTPKTLGSAGCCGCLILFLVTVAVMIWTVSVSLPRVNPAAAPRGTIVPLLQDFCLGIRMFVLLHDFSAICLGFCTFARAAAVCTCVWCVSATHAEHGGSRRQCG